MCDLYQLALAVAFIHLAVDQAWLHLPSEPVVSSTTRGKPLAKVGGESIKVAIESITGKQWDATRRQPLLESMDEPMGHGLGAGAELKCRKNLGESEGLSSEREESPNYPPPSEGVPTTRTDLSPAQQEGGTVKT